MKYYKITENEKCLNQKYEVGETYSLLDDPILCQYGFHFCQNPDHLFIWYDYNRTKTVIFEVKPLGKTIHQENKSVTNKIKIIRKINPEEYNDLFKNAKFDENYNLIHYKSSNGFEYWNKYDENNNLIRVKTSSNYKYWFKYNKNNNIIYYKNSKGFEEWYKYDENNNLIHWKNSNGFEYWRKYDENNNNLIYCKNCYGYEKWYKYDENNNLIHSKDSNGDK